MIIIIKRKGVRRMKHSKKLGVIIPAICLMAGSFIMSDNAFAAEDINISFPADRGVFQRGADNTADITVKASVDTTQTVKAELEGEGITSKWVELTKTENGYEGTIEDVAAGGWYSLVVATFDSSGNETGRSTVDHVGVGEVFITGGQSNSCNFGGEKTEAESDLVSAFDPKNDTWQHCEDSQPNNSGFGTGNEGGSPWPTFGDKLVEMIDVPVGLYSTGRGSAKISELKGTFYGTIKEAIDKIAPYGCRAFLLHQGEADTNDTPNDEYLADLKDLIQMTRDDAGYDINWFVAQVSYAWSNYNNKEKMDAQTATQRAACNNYDIFVGPTTDDLLGDYRRKQDNLHLSKAGLIEHGTRWADVVYNKLFTEYKLEAETVGGSIKECDKGQYAGNKVILTPQADPGYYYVENSLKVTGSEGDIELDNNSFVMRAEDLKVSAEFAKLPAHFDTLYAAIDQAEKIDANAYEKAGIDALNAAVSAAKTVYANPKSTEADTTKAKNDLENAIKALVKKQSQAAGTGANTSQTANTDNIQKVTPATNNTQNKAGVGTVITVGNLKYTITSSDKLTVSVKTIVKNKASVTIPKSVKYDGKKYKVTGIEKNAFAKASKLKKVTIKSTTITSIGKNAFKKLNKAAKIKVPKKKLKAYKKLLKKAGVKKQKISC